MSIFYNFDPYTSKNVVAFSLRRVFRTAFGIDANPFRTGAMAQVSPISCWLCCWPKKRAYLMKAFSNQRITLLLAALIMVLASIPSTHAQSKVDTIKQQDLAGFPYHPLVYHADLSNLAYQLYSQTLVWPFDPYYVEPKSRNDDRSKLIDKIRAWAKSKGAEQVKKGAKLGGYRGPGILAGFANNTSHDPILYHYSQLYPWSRSTARDMRQWAEHKTPKTITGKIRSVYMCYRKTGKSESSVAVQRVVSSRSKTGSGARDVLLAFEGGTGDKGEKGRPASQSLMGFVLLRHIPGRKQYDVHIAFRGSRSGSIPRAIGKAFNDKTAAGNPDWITDLGYNRIGPNNGGRHISTKGTVHRGFAKSMKSILPNLFGCLSKTAQLAPGSRPKNIYVTGHSLGGALAQHFVSAVLMGGSYGPDGKGKAMPKALRKWPWKQIKLITFSSPRAGDAKWAKELTTHALASKFFSSRVFPIDRKALSVSNLGILPRLVDPSRPAGYRVLISTDPVTTERVAGGKHVGQTIYINKAKLVATPDITAHNLSRIRKLMLATLSDSRIPRAAKPDPRLEKSNAKAEKMKRASLKKFTQLATSLGKSYRDKKQWFNHKVFKRDFEIFKSILQGN